MLKVFYHRAKFGGARILPAAAAAKTLSFCLSDCLFVTLLNVRDCAPDFAMKHWSTETILTPLDRGRFVVVTCVQISQTATNWRHH